MQRESHQDAESAAKKPKTNTVNLNERPVTFSQHKATGLEIKQAAIKQGVAIQLDFVLFEVKGNSSLKQIEDGEIVNLHEGQKFRAITTDDNS